MKNKKVVIIIGSLLGVFLLSALVGGRQGFYDLYKSNREFHRRSEKIQDAKAVRDSLIQEKKKLLHDTAHIERIAREKLGMAKKNEKVFKFVEENK